MFLFDELARKKGKNELKKKGKGLRKGKKEGKWGKEVQLGRKEDKSRWESIFHHQVIK